MLETMYRQCCYIPVQIEASLAATGMLDVLATRAVLFMMLSVTPSISTDSSGKSCSTCIAMTPWIYVGKQSQPYVLATSKATSNSFVLYISNISWLHTLINCKTYNCRLIERVNCHILVFDRYNKMTIIIIILFSKCAIVLCERFTTFCMRNK